MIAIRYLTIPNDTKIAWIVQGGDDPNEMSEILAGMSEEEIELLEKAFKF